MFTPPNFHRLLSVGWLVVLLFSAAELTGQSEELLKKFNTYRALKEERKFVEAIPIAESALLQFEQEFGKDHHYCGICLHDIALMYRYSRQSEKALHYITLSLENIALSLGKEHHEYGIRLQDMAGIYKDMGMYEKALPLYFAALDNAEKSIGRSHAFYGVYLNDLATLYYEMAQYDKALPLYLESLDNTLKNRGKEHFEYGTRLNNLAALYEAMGLHEKSLPLYLEAVENTEKTMGKDHPTYGMNLNNLAGYYERMGQYDKAHSTYLASLENTEKSFGREHPYYGVRLNNLAGLYERLGQYEKALPLYLEAMANTEKSLGKAHPYYGSRLNNLGINYESQGDYAKAQELYQEALVNTKTNLGKDHPEYGASLNNLAGIYKITGKYAEAHPLYLEALQIAENILGKQHNTYAERLYNLASLYYLMNEPGRVMALCREFWEIKKEQISGSFGYLSEKEKDALIKTMEIQFQSMQRFCWMYAEDSMETAGFSYDLELATKGMILASGINMQSAIRSLGDTQVLVLYDEWLLLRATIARQQALPLDRQRRDLSELQEQAEKIEAQLARQTTELSGRRDIGLVNWKQIQQHLGEHDVAIEFASFGYGKGNYSTDSTLYIALVLRKNDAIPRMVQLCTERQLDSLLIKTDSDDPVFISGLYRGGQTHSSRQEMTHTRRLYELVWKPFDSLLNAGDRIHFAPSGRLNQLAFAAIPYGKKQNMLSDRYRLVQLSTTAMLTVQHANNRPGKLTLIGGVDYETFEGEPHTGSDTSYTGTRTAAVYSNESWNYLEGTLTEVKNIAVLAASAQIQYTILEGNNASEERLKAMAGKASPHVLHIATHGYFFPDPEKTAVKQISSNAPAAVFKSSKNALNRSGILLSGSNKSWHNASAAKGREDGIYTALEASYVPLFNTELVVLSACETGLGDIKGSEGVYGLQRAFKAAGARYIMMSLWKVPDAETAAFMAEFYMHYLGGLSIPDAFDHAQRFMRNQYRKDPYKWAAFVLTR
jgi:CHAT domain-containing protein